MTREPSTQHTLDQRFVARYRLPIGCHTAVRASGRQGEQHHGTKGRRRAFYFRSRKQNRAFLRPAAAARSSRPHLPALTHYPARIHRRADVAQTRQRETGEASRRGGHDDGHDARRPGRGGRAGKIHK